MRLYLSRIEQMALAVLLLAIFGALFVLSYAYGRRQRGYADAPFLGQAQAEEEAADLSPDIPASEIVVHVTGAVKNPGVYRFSSNDRIDDAVRRAGGVREDGYAEAFNLAARLEDGERICVPTKAEWAQMTKDRAPPPLVIAGAPSDPLHAAPVSGAVSPGPAVKTDGKPAAKTGDSPVTTDAGPKPLPAKKVNLNTATLEELMTLPNVGPVTARRILDCRKAQGKFTDLAQLLNVPGIGPKTYEKLAPYIEL